LTYVTIGEFARRTRLSSKALRIYDELGLVVPAEVDPSSGYRRYGEEQVARAQLVAMLRRLDMPLADIASVLQLDGSEAARAVGDWWARSEVTHNDRRGLVAYLQACLRGEEAPMYDIELRTMPERTLLSINRHVGPDAIDAFFDEAFTRLRAAAPGVAGIEGVPFLMFYGEVSEDGDGPIELCRPVDAQAADLDQNAIGDIQVRVEPAHDEAFIRLTAEEIGWPAMLPAYDALERWVNDHGRASAGVLRQLLFADLRIATPDTAACDLSVPLR
jgi:DNA-binding transcriptional MerR regulator